MSEEAETLVEGGIQIVPYEMLSEDALRGVIEDFVTREGTDYGHVDVTLESKVRAVKKQLERGEALITFDPKTESCTIEPRR